MGANAIEKRKQRFYSQTGGIDQSMDTSKPKDGSTLDDTQIKLSTQITLNARTLAQKKHARAMRFGLPLPQNSTESISPSTQQSNTATAGNKKGHSQVRNNFADNSSKKRRTN